MKLRLEKYDYYGLKSLIRKFEGLGQRNSNDTTTEEQDKIEAYLDNFAKDKKSKQKV
ncbi:hypothetical protein [Pedobacter sp. FW305-3-2-15-E-R2A2]|uniref:hypothetical protein n=1 Tax=Pedobacter sp. FW305-3-2-15-E-R2A2 TaxID=3140251 RepID=UPI0031408337